MGLGLAPPTGKEVDYLGGLYKTFLISEKTIGLAFSNGADSTKNTATVSFGASVESARMGDPVTVQTVDKTSWDLGNQSSVYYGYTEVISAPNSTVIDTSSNATMEVDNATFTTLSSALMKNTFLTNMGFSCDSKTGMCYMN